jgi:GTP-binding protein
MPPVVVIVGRTNVGKSTLFNRLIGRRLAIVDAIPGVTRDRMYAEAHWPFGRFGVVDTGGWDQADPEMRQLVDEQRRIALAEADLVLFVVDAIDGLLPEDVEIAEALRRLEKPLVIVANKADNERIEVGAADFYSLGLDADVLPLSAKGKRNFRRLLEVIQENVGGFKESPESGPFPIAIVGRPNSGKSSLVNALVGEQRLITSEVPGTTRDAVGVPFRYSGREYLLVDTAGLRKRKKVRGELLERLTVVRALEHIRRSRLVLMLVDAVEGLVTQDAKILGYALEEGRAAVLVFNKCDLVELNRTERRRLTEDAHGLLGFAAHVPVDFTSATEGLGLNLLMAEIGRVAEAYGRKLPTPELNRVLEKAQEAHPPPHYRGKEVKLLYAVQTGTGPPSFTVFTNRAAELHFSWRRFLENRLREAGGWAGVPLCVEYRTEKRPRRRRGSSVGVSNERGKR